MKAQKFYVDGKILIPDEDLLLCEVPGNNLLFEQFDGEGTKVYATLKRTFYKVVNSKKRMDIALMSEDETMNFLNKNPAYVVTDNYDKLFKKPERG